MQELPVIFLPNTSAHWLFAGLFVVGGAIAIYARFQKKQKSATMALIGMGILLYMFFANFLHEKNLTAIELTKHQLILGDKNIAIKNLDSCYLTTKVAPPFYGQTKTLVLKTGEERLFLYDGDYEIEKIMTVIEKAYK